MGLSASRSRGRCVSLRVRRLRPPQLLSLKSQAVDEFVNQLHDTVIGYVTRVRIDIWTGDPEVLNRMGELLHEDDSSGRQPDETAAGGAESILFPPEHGESETPE